MPWTLLKLVKYGLNLGGGRGGSVSYRRGVLYFKTLGPENLGAYFQRGLFSEGLIFQGFVVLHM